VRTLSEPFSLDSQCSNRQIVSCNDNQVDHVALRAPSEARRHRTGTRRRDSVPASKAAALRSYGLLILWMLSNEYALHSYIAF
jgi:hypothetical protein